MEIRLPTHQRLVMWPCFRGLCYWGKEKVFRFQLREGSTVCTVEPLLMDTLNKGYLSIRC